MMNAWFPNPVVSPAFEQEWSDMLRRYNLPTLSRIPAELTYRGEYPAGLFGALFLLAPVALASMRYPEGRRTLVAFAVFALPYPMNIGSRLLIPAVPFLASRWRSPFRNGRQSSPSSLSCTPSPRGRAYWSATAASMPGVSAKYRCARPFGLTGDHFLSRKREDYA